MDLARASDAAILAVVDPIMDNLMEASTASDYARHVRDFTPRLRDRLPQDAFECICKDYQAARGFFGARECMAIFRRPDSVAVIWRQAFTRVAGEYVAELVLVQDGDRYRVDHVMVF